MGKLKLYICIYIIIYHTHEKLYRPLQKERTNAEASLSLIRDKKLIENEKLERN